MTKTYFYFCIFIPLISLYSCKDSNPCASTDLILNISEQTNSWLQNNYFDTTSMIKFENIIGEEKIFEYSKTLHHEFEQVLTIDCENGEDQKVNLLYERIARIYESQDSFEIVISTNLNAEECVWGGKDNTRMFEALRITISNKKDPYYSSDSRWGILGIINIITNELDSGPVTDYCKESYSFYPNFTIANTEFVDIFAEDSIKNHDTNILYSKDLGLVGFIEQNQIEWKIK